MPHQLKKLDIKTEDAATTEIPKVLPQLLPISKNAPNELVASQPKISTKNKSTAAAAAAPAPMKNNRPITRSQSLKDNKNPQQVKAFNVCSYADKYAAKKKQAMSKMISDDKKNREFHSRPAPDFTLARKKMDEKFQKLRKLPTCPNSPKVYQSSKEMIDKRNKKVSIFFSLFSFLE